ncbi:EexN family lipoprotein [Bartonella raoultii]|uniref:EexN family lipoprotein n=1 Tax=Bartonella raoultii TaxID=1457020 RepID=UPI001ABA749D|nr:EexN family lipoprotein [Bartonella raoultii]
MNKVLITTLLLCTGLITAGCGKNYSVAEFKKDKKLLEEWAAKCGWSGTSQNCKNLRTAENELRQERFDDYLKQLHKELDEDMKKTKEEAEKQKDRN